MKAAAPVLAALAVAGAAAALERTAARDWPQWRGPARNGAAPALASRTAWPETLTPAWKAEVGEGHASPVVDGGRVFAFARSPQGDEEVLQAFDLASGRRLWRQAYAAPYTMNPAATGHGKGPKSTPVAAEGRVHTLGITGVLSTHDAATGRLLWRHDFAGRFARSTPLYGTAQSPLVDRGRVIVHVGGHGDGALTAFDAARGTTLWSWKGDGPAYSSPVAATIGGQRQVVTFTESLLVGVHADSGKLLWKRPFTTDYVQNAVTPLVHGDTVIYSGLEHPVKAVRIVPRGGSWAVEPRWENAEVALYMSSPVLAGDRVCGLSHRRKGQFFCLEAATGRTLWLSPGRQGENAAVVAAGTRLLALVTDGELVVAEAASPAYRELRRYRVADSPTWAHVAVVGGEGVLVKDAGTLAYLRFR